MVDRKSLRKAAAIWLVVGGVYVHLNTVNYVLFRLINQIDKMSSMMMVAIQINTAMFIVFEREQIGLMSYKSLFFEYLQIAEKITLRIKKVLKS